MKRDLSLKRLIYVLFLILPVASLKAQSGNIEFIENKGQWDKKVKFQGSVPSGSFFVREGGGFTVLQHNTDDLEAIHNLVHGKTKGAVSGRMANNFSLRSHAFHVDFVGASSRVEIIADKPLDTYNNYFIGNDPSKWVNRCKIYQGITVKNVYPNVDIRYYTQGGSLKYDIIANPGADINKIALRYDGVDKLEIDKKELSVSTSVGRVKELAPYTFQFNAKGKKDLDCRYVIKDNTVRFNVKNYDRNSTIVIDPTVVFISFSGSSANNWGYTATYGPDGSMFGGGIVFSEGFPTSTGAFQQHFQGGVGDPVEGEGPFDIGIIKLSPDGRNRIYATYIGGSKGDEQPHSLVVDGNGNLIMAGRSNSDDYPTTGTGVLGVGGGHDIVVTKLDPSGGILLGSKRIGGEGEDGVNISTERTEKSLQLNYGDDGRSEVILDNAGNIYVASCTRSRKFPVKGGFKNTMTDNGDEQDGVVIKLLPDVSDFVFSTYLGGNKNDAAYVLSLSPSGNIYVGGATESDQNFPGMTASGTIGSANFGAIDGFITILSNNGALVKSTYVGTDQRDAVYGLKFDRLGFPYIMGQTYGDWPHINAPYYDAGAKQFIAKLQPDLSAYVYSTIFGKNALVPSISPVAFLVDRCENVYVSGWGGPPSGFASSGTTGLPVTPDAFQSSSIDNQDFYFFVLKKNATAQLYGSFLGENNSKFPDHVDGGTSRFDQNGIIYQGICGNCVPLANGSKPRFPTTPGVWAPTNGSRFCNLAMVKISFNLAGVGAGIQASIDGVPRDTAGCVPLTVDFKDTVANAKTYEWTFGDGSPTVITTLPNISHTYTAIGTYTVMLVSVDSNTCNMRDTVFTHIRAGDKRAVIGLSFTKLDPCDSFKYQFNNLSVAPPGVPFGNKSFVWSFGDGSNPDTTGTNPVFHNYSAPGSYHVKLTLIDSNYCNAPELIDTVLSVADVVIARFETPPTGCAPYTVTFDNTSQAGQTFIWDFGDGTANSTEFQPTHTYQLPGQYTIRLTANNDFTCNKTDDTTVTIQVYGKPVANYSYTPVPPIENTPNVFTNQSSDDAINFIWYFGDGDSVVTSSRALITHQYRATGTFNACLVAINAAGCTDTICKPVEVIINPLVDVPNAFTPNSGDINSKVMVKGFGIAKMRFIIWNRWGQKVFETNDQNIGWDGRFKGAMQPMDVYAYTLDVQFFDGTKATRKGDITLIK
ncbi:MAG: PKD domain-containing protein [Bacteroidetes bacterium]|nr:PKD domain-containing protein [Bacteroidota bacterium]